MVFFLHFTNICSRKRATRFQASRGPTAALLRKLAMEGIYRYSYVEGRDPPSLASMAEMFGGIIYVRRNVNPPRTGSYASSFSWTIALDPGGKRFFHGINPVTGDEFIFGIGYDDGILNLEDAIAAIQSQLDNDINTDEQVRRAQSAVDVSHSRFLSSHNHAQSEASFTILQQSKSNLSDAKAVARERISLLYASKMESLRLKLKSLIESLHNVTAIFLCQWEMVITPRMGIHDMIKRGSGLGKRSKIVLVHLKHCGFITKLTKMMAKYDGVVVEVTESYSTRLCSHCGCLNSPGRSRIYHCHGCRRHMDRDGNAAMNIFNLALARALLFIQDRLEGRDWKPGDDSDDDDPGDYSSDDGSDVSGDGVESVEGEEFFGRGWRLKRRHNEGQRLVPMSEEVVVP